MSIIELKDRPFSPDSKASRNYQQFRLLITLLRERALPPQAIQVINKQIEELNASTLDEKKFLSNLRQRQTKLLHYLSKEVKIVPRGYYRNLWMVLGMSAFGIPFGMLFGLTMKNMGLLGIGLPIGMAIGLAVGAGMDKKAQREERQLDMEIKY